MASSVYSTPEQFSLIEKILTRYIRLPFTVSTIPGAIMEGVLAHVRDGRVLQTYDFVDVVKTDAGFGWQVKSTKECTPVTWKRAKIPNAEELIAESQRSPAGRQELGNAIINFCNQHALESLESYRLDQIGYARLLIRDDGSITYFERLLCTRANPQIFNPHDFEWKWSTPKKTVRKEQLCALHGISRRTGEKWWAWHGLGENQLHFSGERNWWPTRNGHAITFRFPTEREKISLEDFSALLEKFDADS